MRETPSRAEQVYSIVLAGKRRPPIWHEATFLKAEPSLASLLSLADTRIAVRSVQAEKDGNAARLGRLTWSPAGHKRWLHDVTGETTSRTFCFTEIWAPSWSQCEKEDGAPFVFVAIANPFLQSIPRDGQFNQLIHVALPVALVRYHSTTVRAALAEITAAIECVFGAYRVTPWWHDQDSVQDGITNHLTYLGLQNDTVPDLVRLRGSWQPFTGELFAPAA